MTDVLMIPLDNIISEGNVRFSENDISSLATSMDRQGQLQPISVKLHPEPMENGDNRYVVIAGHRRVAAAQSIPWTTIDAIVNDAVDTEADRIAVQYAENVFRKDLSALEKAQATLELKEQGLNQETVADELGLSKGEVSKQQKAARKLAGSKLQAHATLLSDETLFELAETNLEGEGLDDAIAMLVSGDAHNVSRAVWQVEREQQQRELTAKLAEWERALTKKGVTFVDELPKNREAVSTMGHYGFRLAGDLPIDSDWLVQHRTLECHVASRGESHNGDFINEYCVKPASHREKGKSGLKEASAEERHERREADKAARKADREAKQLRLDAVKDRLTGKVTQKELVELASRVLSLRPDTARTICRALELEKIPSQYGDYPDYNAMVTKWIEQQLPSKQPLIKIMMMAGYSFVEEPYAQDRYVDVFPISEPADD